METLQLTRCPEVDDSGEVCDSLTEITDRSVVESTDGPVELIKSRCLVSGHILFCLAESFAEPPSVPMPRHPQE